ncbi:immune inhibitor A [Arsenicicoccus piscis]|uniref:Protease n=1 Tax=Arsenicicoccus piscis TaxID=673954 RepID=A0ABQ6HTA9_9MICO|nr:immune inhibitor A domain-containing protein [Arsenicicoccus piscis]MCH8626732.1 immune inhibitor A [Arsenicicoccus piscis]GMA21412.1 protease [Arsenicicoccus piscis]
MIRRIVGLASGAAIVASLTAIPVSLSASAAPSVDTPDPAVQQSAKVDDKSHPLGDKQRALRQRAVDQLVAGTADVTSTAGGGKTVRVGKGQYVQLGVNREESIFTILAEFGTQTKPAQGGTPGPLHNQIPEPVRSPITSPDYDNSTIWQADYNRAHYTDLMFGATNSFKDFYLKQSNGRFLAKGDVSDWVKLPYNEARYGHNPVAGDGTSEGEGYWSFVGDTATAWYNAQKAAGKSDADIKAYLAQFDTVDRYDYDQDGNFNEPDGYIDHFQAIHAGEGEEAGGGAEGEDAIWSHRWYAYPNGAGSQGPAFNKQGGVQLGNSGIWIGDYTTEPENGGLGVFTHEFGHDLGLPDLYDTAGGDNGTGFWTLMSAGSWLNNGTVDIGSEPGYMGPWEKLQLGWLDYQTVQHGAATQVKLGPADLTGKMPQAILVNLPPVQKVTNLPAPHSGANQWWSGSADDMNNSLNREIDLTGATSGSVSAWLNYEIENGYDFLKAEVSADNGASWQALNPVITGSSKGAWVQKSWDLGAYAGKKVQFRFHATSDGGVHLRGALIDDIATTVGTTTTVDDVESATSAWTAHGFLRVGASYSEAKPNYYLAENRTYNGYDQFLKTGPYNFGWATTQPKRVERFPYQNGLLVWYVNGLYSDNNTTAHPGGGLTLPVDARPAPIVFPDGRLLGNRRQPFDATFGQEATDPVTFHRNGAAVNVPSQRAIPVFDDSDVNRYWSAANPLSSTKVAGSGTRLEVVSTSKQGDSMQVRVSFTK